MSGRKMNPPVLAIVTTYGPWHEIESLEQPTVEHLRAYLQAHPDLAVELQEQLRVLVELQEQLRVLGPWVDCSGLGPEWSRLDIRDPNGEQAVPVTLEQYEGRWWDGNRPCPFDGFDEEQFERESRSWATLEEAMAVLDAEAVAAGWSFASRYPAEEP